MKAALVSATSLAALLAFEVGLDVAVDARPAMAATFAVTPGNNNFGYVLLSTLGSASTAVVETVTNETSSKNTITIPALSSSPFSGSALNHVFSASSSGASTTNSYTFAPTVTGIYKATVTVTSTITSGASSGSTTAAITLSGQAVAPVASIVLNPYARVGGGAQTIAAITVSNVGDGDLVSSTLSTAQLRGSIGAISGSVFTRSGSTSTFSLNDSNYGTGTGGTGTATTSATFNYVYTPTARGAGGTGSLTISFTNGNPNGTNKPTVVAVTLTGQGVGPTYESNIKGSVFSNTTVTGHTTVAAGTIATGAYKTGTTTSMVITLSNASTDPNGGNSSLTNLTLESDSITGANASNFSIVGFTTNTVLGEAGVVDVTLDFSGSTMGSYTANLAFTTDQGFGLGGVGAVFNYVLTANIPEPATVVTFGMGLAGLGWARRKRAARRSVTGTNTLAI
jgi:hypothetical protein